MQPDDAQRHYWQVRTVEALAYVAAAVVVLAPLVAEAIEHEPFASWVARLKSCPGCARRREGLRRRMLGEYDRDEQAVLDEATRVVRRARGRVDRGDQ